MSGAFVAKVCDLNYDSTSTKTPTVPVLAPVAVGNTVVLFADCPGASANTVFGVTDSKGNAWTVRVFGVNSAPSNGQFMIATMTAAAGKNLTTSDTITPSVDVAGATRWIVYANVYSGIASYDKASTPVASSGSSLSSGSSGTPAQSNQLVCGCFARTGAGETVTPTGIAAGMTYVNRETTTTIRDFDIFWGFVNSSSARTITATMGGSHPAIGALILMNETAPANQGVYRLDAGPTLKPVAINPL